MSTLKTLGAAAVMALTVGSANASILDFTDPASYTISPANVASGMIDGVNWTLTASGGNIVEGANGPGPIAAAPLLGATDGLGIFDDELTAGVETFTLMFDQVVTVLNVYFLDLFIARNNTGLEVATVSVDGGAPVHFNAQVSEAGNTIGFGAFATSLTGSSFLFTAEFSNDTRGNPDYALAGLDLAPIPLPAGVLLLGGALGALGFARRRKTA